jgi:hypothetical protein
VDDEQVARPRPWNMDEIKRFILFIGPVSSIFDYTTRRFSLCSGFSTAESPSCRVARVGRWRSQH